MPGNTERPPLEWSAPATTWRQPAAIEQILPTNSCWGTKAWSTHSPSKFSASRKASSLGVPTNLHLPRSGLNKSLPPGCRPLPATFRLALRRRHGQLPVVPLSGGVTSAKQRGQARVAFGALVSAQTNSAWPCTHPAGGAVTTKNPNAILRRIRSSVAMVNRNSPAVIPPDVHDLIQAVTDLDNHLSWGGDPPDDWRVARFATPAVPPISQVLEPLPANGLDPVEDIIRRM